ncbi:MAG: alpha/beta hydrolase [Bacteroidota bacterium]
MQTLKKRTTTASLRNRFFAVAIAAGFIQGLSLLLHLTSSVLRGGWGLCFALLNILAAVALVLFVRPLPEDRLRLGTLVAAGYLVLSSLGVLVIQGTAHPRPGAYTLPSQATRYELPFQKVSLLTSDGVRLKGMYLGQKRATAVLLYPGWLTNKESFSLVTLAQWLANRHDVLVLDPRGQGESGGAQDAAGSGKFDLLAGVAYLRSEGARQGGVLAETDGAYPAILAAGEQQAIDSLALASPSGRWGLPLLGDGFWRDPHNPLGRWYWRLATGLRLRGGASRPTAEVIGRVAPIPLLLLESAQDPQRIASQLHLVAREPRSLMLLPGAGHPVGWPHFDKYVQAVSQWFNLTLVKKARVEDAAVDPAQLSETAESSEAVEETAGNSEATASSIP